MARLNPAGVDPIVKVPPNTRTLGARAARKTTARRTVAIFEGASSPTHHASALSGRCAYTAGGPPQADRLRRRRPSARISPGKNAKRMFDQPAQLGEKRGANGSVDDAVVARQRHAEPLSNRHDAVGHDRGLAHLADREDCSFGR